MAVKRINLFGHNIKKMLVNFSKFEGTGNDFIIIDAREFPIGLLTKGQVAGLCDRHRGIGADGLMLLYDHPDYDFRMVYFNSDGGEAEMCGNGARCITLYADQLGIGGDAKRFVGRDGSHTAIVSRRSGPEAMVEIGIVDVCSYEFGEGAFFLNTGVPHYVEFVENIISTDVFNRGREIRYSEKYLPSGGTNVNFVQIEGPGKIIVRTYERGVEDETLACGTGAVASAIATHIYAQSGVTQYEARVEGGILHIQFTPGQDNCFRNITLKGPARRVFDGQVRISEIIDEI
ncbi:MAG: diaminopimelate epimerase [Rikenellaceae bacterium]|nr:diaminopimelate epimerase [Rikenellaceae bacterium]